MSAALDGLGLALQPYMPSPFLGSVISGLIGTSLSPSGRPGRDWASIWKDIVVGLLIAGALGAWVPNSFWQGFFLVGHPLLDKLWGPLVGPVVAVFSFVCSVGNVPLAAVPWNGGISFGGAMSFI